MILSFKYRVKDATVRSLLRRHATACNQVWNYCVEVQREAERRRAGNPFVSWPSAFDLINLCAGASFVLSIHSDTIAVICRQFAASRDQRRPSFRSSHGINRSLGWVPFVKRCVRIEDGRLTYLKKKIHFWQSQSIQGDVKAGCFAEDARGRWYVCFQCEVSDQRPTGIGQIGIDLGLKALATCSDGTVIPALQHYRQYQAALATAQRARNKRRVRAIHAKIANSRRHHLHEWSAKLASENKLIVVGNVSPSKLVKSRMAKSIMDASWAILRSQLRYKASRHGARYVEADERWTSQVCSCCGRNPASSPKGIGALGIRHWECSNCGTSHDRDVNAARNSLNVGAECRPPVVGMAIVAKALKNGRGSLIESLEGRAPKRPPRHR